MMNMKMMSPRKRMDMEGSGPVRMAKGGSACGTKKMMAGGMTKGYAKGGVTRADGCCMKGHTKGKMV
jgi:hypothetical protein